MICGTPHSPRDTRRIARVCLAVVRLLAIGMPFTIGPWFEGCGATVLGQDAPVQFHARPDYLEITVGSEPIARYVFSDPKISRPYFCDLYAPGRKQVSRNHPPRPGQDATDHDLFHPGLWLAFGDLGGNDYWRLKSQVEHERFLEPPQAGVGHGAFQVRNRYRSEKGDATVCEEVFRTDVWVRPFGYLLVVQAEYVSPDHDFAFGDQEEMGLGIRVATPISVAKGGTMRDADGRVNERQIWGQSAAWCDYSGTIDGTPAGILLIPDPGNFRPSRYHARDYGFIAANPFAIKSFQAGPASQTTVKRGERFRIRFAVLLHSGQKPDEQWLAEAYRDARTILEMKQP